jgi:hypothetical protein
MGGDFMRFKGLLVIFSAMVRVAFCGTDLWLIEQDFVKFGKKEVYEKYKKEMLVGSSMVAFAAQEDDLLQYIYLFPVNDYSGLGDLMQKRADYDRSLGTAALLPYLSTLNFTMRSVHQYLPNCSSIPKGKESLSAYRNIYFYLFGVKPGNETDFEARLEKIATEEARDMEVCLRSWKIAIGSSVPKYLVAVFAPSEKQAQKRAEGLEFITLPMKNLLYSQKQGVAVLRKDLSVGGS